VPGARQCELLNCIPLQLANTIHIHWIFLETAIPGIMRGQIMPAALDSENRPTRMRERGKNLRGFAASRFRSFRQVLSPHVESLAK
jgi:hypothetical protein